MAYLIIGDNHPVVFLANIRTGSTAIANALMKNGAYKDGEHHEPMGLYPQGALIVQTIRNHFDVISSYWYKKANGHTLDNFVDIVVSGDHIHFPPTGLYSKFGTNPNYFLEYNTLDYEFSNLCLAAGLPDIKLERTNNTNRPPNEKRQDLFTSDLVRKIQGYYGAEMERLGYGRN